jgi:WD repeat-containing protein 48
MNRVRSRSKFMAPLPPRRRVSYGVPFPPSTNPIPLLWLPPLGFDRQGSVDPILISNSDQNPSHGFQPHQDTSPRHRLGVSSLALDTTTQLVGRPSPEGILYTGGRDGLVIAWDLKLPMRKRTRTGDPPRPNSTRWELVTGWIDPITDDLPEEGEDMRSDGDILGEVRGSARRRKLSSATATHGSIPFEHMWEPDVDAFRAGQVCLYLLPESMPSHSTFYVLSVPPSVRQLRYTQTG